jgi:biopolymer transport protein TolQ
MQMQVHQEAQVALQSSAIALDPVHLLVHATLPVKITVGILVLASTFVWAVGALKSLQLRGLRKKEAAFEREAAGSRNPSELLQAAGAHTSAPGGRIVAALAKRPDGSSHERLSAVAERAVVSERQSASALVTPLGTIASVSPFVGLFGTVYGIMDAFIRIGAEKSASLPVVAPAIGEALLTTAIGLACAIPAVVVYNATDKRISDYMDELEASTGEWVSLLSGGAAAHSQHASSKTPGMGGGYEEAAAFPLVSPSRPPRAR